MSSDQFDSFQSSKESKPEPSEEIDQMGCTFGGGFGHDPKQSIHSGL